MRSAGGTITLLRILSSLLHIFCTVQIGCRFPAGDAPKRSFPLPLTSPQWLSLPFLPSYYIMSVPGCQAPCRKSFLALPHQKRTSVLSDSFMRNCTYIRCFSRVKAVWKDTPRSGRNGVFSPKTEQNHPCRFDRNNIDFRAPFCAYFTIT